MCRTALRGISKAISTAGQLFLRLSIFAHFAFLPEKERAGSRRRPDGKTEEHRVCRRLTGSQPRIEREFFNKAPEHPWLTPMPSPVSRFPITKATKGKLQGRCRVRARRGRRANHAPPRHTMTVVGCMWSPLSGHDWPLSCTSAFPVLGRRREAGCK